VWSACSATTSSSAAIAASLSSWRCSPRWPLPCIRIDDSGCCFLLMFTGQGARRDVCLTCEAHVVVGEEGEPRYTSAPITPGAKADPLLVAVTGQ
jgi:hypothetical protein